jgi:CRP-like cAMP-binding protein
MLKKSLFTSLLKICKEHNVEYKIYKQWDIVMDDISDHNLYIFEKWLFTVSAKSGLGWVHEVGEIDSPSIIGEWVFFGTFRKPVKVVLDSEEGGVYLLSEKMIANITEKNIFFREMLMRACLAVTSERIAEANTERTLGYTLVDALENRDFESIPALLSTLSKTFSVSDAIWIERHEVLHDIFAMRYRDSHGPIPVNTRVTLDHHRKEPYVEEWLFDSGYSHIYPLCSRGECFGYLVYISDKKRLPGYISRITLDMAPNCIRIIEAGWKNK